MKRKKRKRKKIKSSIINKIKLFIKVFSVLLFVYLIYYLIVQIRTTRKSIPKKLDDSIKIEDVNQVNSNIVIKLSKEASCSINESNWVDSINKECTFEDTYYINKLYLKLNDGQIYEKTLDVNYSYIEDFSVNENEVYIAVGGTKKINYKLDYKGKINGKVSFVSDDPSIVSIDENGVITGNSSGTANISVSFNNKKQDITVTISSLIVPMQAEFDYDKDQLPCDNYSEEENDLLDKILQSRVTEAGYKTRAGAVAVARFIGLEFPYKINYFSENGRLPAVDGEGRYYHEGLYLHSSRYEKLGKSMHGPKPWGCYMYSVPAEKEIRNGLDCSGFISWVIKNAGFEPGDIGAGISPGYDDLTDLGQLNKLSDMVEQGKVKVGDLLSGDGDPNIVPINGGHIAMLVGIKDGNYYVAEELWWGTGYVGAIIRNYNLTDFLKYFYWIIDMDEFYGNDGNLTDYWLN